jgi:hypothetical protein
MLILICGTRQYRPEFVKPVVELLKKLDSAKDVIMTGAAPGIDTIALNEAKRLGFQVLACPADWSKYGKAAGPIRNSTMIARKPDRVYCFPWPSLQESRGTQDTYNKARAAGLITQVISLRGE